MYVRLSLSLSLDMTDDHSMVWISASLGWYSIPSLSAAVQSIGCTYYSFERILVCLYICVVIMYRVREALSLSLSLDMTDDHSMVWIFSASLGWYSIPSLSAAVQSIGCTYYSSSIAILFF
jgi:hypothetical protein